MAKLGTRIAFLGGVGLGAGLMRALEPGLRDLEGRAEAALRHTRTPST